jgi:hypothetical protein
MPAVGSGAPDKRIGRAVFKTSIYIRTNERVYATMFSCPQLKHQA